LSVEWVAWNAFLNVEGIFKMFDHHKVHGESGPLSAKFAAAIRVSFPSFISEQLCYPHRGLTGNHLRADRPVLNDNPSRPCSIRVPSVARFGVRISRSGVPVLGSIRGSLDE
jgi:hypothetical protein